MCRCKSSEKEIVSEVIYKDYVKRKGFVVKEVKCKKCGLYRTKATEQLTV